MSFSLYKQEVIINKGYSLSKHYTISKSNSNLLIGTPLFVQEENIYYYYNYDVTANEDSKINKSANTLRKLI